MFTPRLKRPYLCLFWSLPLLAAALIDLYIWQNGGSGFHFAEFGYLLQHYTPYHDPVVNAIDSPIYRAFLKVLFTSKAVLVGLVIALPPVLWINRPRREPDPSAFPRIRR